jgi:Zn-dependent protease with chaperone function
MAERNKRNIIMKSDKRYTAEQIIYAFAGLNEISNEEEMTIADAPTILDRKLVDRIVHDVYFVSSSLIKALCLPLSTSQLKGKRAIIFISDELLNQQNKEIKLNILHEIAHYVLKHKCLFDFEGDGMDKKYMQQEKEADKLVKKWLAS